MTNYTFRTYTKQRNNTEFNKIKELASNTTHLVFCTVVQTGENDGPKDLYSKETKPLNNAQLSKELGLKTKVVKKRKMKGEIIFTCEKSYKEALMKLIHFENDPTLEELRNI